MGRESLILVDVGDHHLRAREQGASARRAVVLDGVEVVEELLVETTLRDDSEPARGGPDELNVPEFGAQERDRAFERIVEDVLEGVRFLDSLGERQRGRLTVALLQEAAERGPLRCPLRSRVVAALERKLGDLLVERDCLPAFRLPHGRCPSRCAPRPSCASPADGNRGSSLTWRARRVQGTVCTGLARLPVPARRRWCGTTATTEGRRAPCPS